MTLVDEPALLSQEADQLSMKPGEGNHWGFGFAAHRFRSSSDAAASAGVQFPAMAAP